MSYTAELMRYMADSQRRRPGAVGGSLHASKDAPTLRLPLQAYRQPVSGASPQHEMPWRWPARGSVPDRVPKGLGIRLSQKLRTNPPQPRRETVGRLARAGCQASSAGLLLPEVG